MIPKQWTTSELYPPEQPKEVGDLLRALPTGEKDRGGRALLYRNLIAVERNALTTRRSAIERFTHAATYGDMAALVLKMMVGFGGKSETEEESRVVAMQCAHMMAGIPLWAVKRTCDRFGAGQVTGEEVGRKRGVDKGFRPTSAELATVARALALPIFQERVAINAIMLGVPERPELSDHERAKEAAAIEEHLADFHASMADGKVAELEHDAKVRSVSLKRTREDGLRLLRAEYEAAGLEPPAGNAPISLAMYQRMGWTIQGKPGHKVLVAPEPE